jgi:5-oxoprolinase (ATP-hydrolysing)
VRASAAGSTIPSGEDISSPGPLPEPALVQKAVFHNGGEQDTPVYELDALEPGHTVAGPALLLNSISTVLVEPACIGHVTAAGDIRIHVRSKGKDEEGSNATTCDPIQLAIFSHRFMSIAEQMGRALQRSSVSVNIKERLDFSCALFGPDGSLVANAPHLPVHLGAMSEAVRAQIKYYTGASRLAVWT